MILEYIIFISIMMCLLWINRRMRQTFFTISNYMIVTFALITGLQVLACAWLKYKTASFEYWSILIIFIVITVVTDLLASSLAKRLSYNGARIKQTRATEQQIENFEKKFDKLSIIASMYSLLLFVHLTKGFPNIYYIVQEEFQSQYASGLNYFVRLLLLIATAYYWGCSKVSKKNMVLGLLCLIPNVLTFVKGIIFIPCLASILLRLKKGDIKISIKTGIIVVCIGTGIFFGVYLVEMGIYNPDILLEITTYQKIGAKLIDYLIAGVQSFSQNVSENNIRAFRIIDNITLDPFMNALSKFGICESVGTVGTVWQIFGFSSIRGVIVESNVNTYVGTLYLYNGIIDGCVLNVFWSFISSFMDEISSEKSNIITAVSALFSTGFALGWFEYYFIQTLWVYLIIIAVIINLLLKTRITTRKRLKKMKVVL